MKRIAALTLVLLLVFSLVTCGYTETYTYNDGYGEFTPTLTNAMGFTGKQMMETSESRAMATIVLALDYMLNMNKTVENEEQFTPNLFETSYIGKNGVDIYVYLKSDTRDDRLVIIYRPVTQEASCDVMALSFGDTQVEYVLKEVCSDGYYKNDIEDIYTVYSTIMKSMDL